MTLECGSCPVPGGLVMLDYALLAVVAGNSLILSFIVYQMIRTTNRLTEMENALGGLFQGLFEKLNKFEELVPDLEPANPLVGILQQMMNNNTTKGRDDAGQFVRAEIIEPKE